MVVDVLLLESSKVIDRAFSYNCSDSMMVEIGSRVIVPFGNGNLRKEAIVVSMEDKPYIEGYKEVLAVSESSVSIKRDIVAMIEHARSYYMESYSNFYKLAIPFGAKLKNDNLETASLKMKQISEKRIVNKAGSDNLLIIYKENFRKNPRIEAFIDKIIVEGIAEYKTGNTDAVLKFIDKCIEEKYFELQETLLFRENLYSSGIKHTKEDKKLTQEQYSAFNEVNDCIQEKAHKQFLLHGVTGSGKTEIFIKLCTEVLALDKSILILVPEINLVPQMVERLVKVFGNIVGVYHSKLTQGQKVDEWLRISSGDFRIIVGARSAVFAPIDNLGLVIVDEEHENSYKSENVPRYDARNLALERAKIASVPIIYSSATPSIELYSRKPKVLKLNDKFAPSKVSMNIIDMKEELKSGNRSFLSRSLRKALEDNLENKQQSLIFINKKGYSSFVSCRECGYVMKCPHCDISLTFHKKDSTAECRLCGYVKKVKNICPECSSRYFKFFGLGTEKVEEQLRHEFPDASILRIDSVTMRSREMPVKVFREIKEGKYDIIVGTQIVAKGHDFPNLTLVGVLSADIDLFVPNYNSAEKTFQLVTQVKGRAGRGDKDSKVIVQTYNSDHYSIIRAIAADYEGFYSDESQVRKFFGYPPQYRMINIVFTSQSIEKIDKATDTYVSFIRKYFDKNDIILVGPSPLINEKIKGNFRHNILLKSEKFDSAFKCALYDFAYSRETEQIRKAVRIHFDVDPVSLM